MSYAQYLQDVLRPLHIYNLDSGHGADEISVLGAAMDGVYSELETTLREMIPLTAQSYGLERYESILPYAPAGSVAERQRAIAALSSASGFCLEQLQSTLRGCGINASLNEYGPETVIVSFEGSDFSDGELAIIKEHIEQIIPSHLAIVYETAYATWRQIEHENFTWNRVEYDELTWHALQTYDVVVEE